jgi:hypothetical protein
MTVNSLGIPSGITAGTKLTGQSGAINSLDVTGVSTIVLNNTTTINGFANGIDRQIVTVLNPSATLCTINHNNGAGTQKIFVPSKQKCILPSASGQISAGQFVYSSDAGAWFYLGADYDEGTYSPTIVSSVGTFTTVTATDARYIRTGKLVTAILNIWIIDKGTAAGEIRISTPIAPVKNAAGSVREIDISGVGGAVYVNSGTGLIYVSRVDNTTIISNGYRLIINVSYEV